MALIWHIQRRARVNRAPDLIPDRRRFPSSAMWRASAGAGTLISRGGVIVRAFSNLTCARHRGVTRIWHPKPKGSGG
jgi:hypothetical protein